MRIVEYYERMTWVRGNGDFEQWVEFFMGAIANSAKDTAETVGKLLDLREKNLEVLCGFGQCVKPIKRIFAYIEEHPITDIEIASAELGMEPEKIRKAAERLRSVGILDEIGKGLFAYGAYLDILKSGTM
jgi:Fic family protein